MSASNYAELLRHPEWQKKRLEVLDLHSFICDVCQEPNGNPLNVHHKMYLKGRSPWDYDNKYFKVLCDVCHKKEHEILNKIQEILSLDDEADFIRIIIKELGDMDVVDQGQLCSVFMNGLSNMRRLKNA